MVLQQTSIVVVFQQARMQLYKKVENKNLGRASLAAVEIQQIERHPAPIFP